MKKINIFHVSQDRSHCSSCRERSDEEIFILMTDLSVDELKEKFKQFYFDELFGKENYEPEDFMKWIDDESFDSDKDSLNYISILYEMDGTTYPPDTYSQSVGEQWDLTKVIIPEEILGKEDWEGISKFWEETKASRLKRDQEKKVEQDKKDKKKAEYDRKMREYNSYLEMKTKFEGTNPIKKPKAPPKTKFEKILEQVRKDRIKEVKNV